MAFVDTMISFFETVVFIFKWFWWAFILIWLIILKLMWKKWPIDAVIIEKRGNNLIKTNDRAGRYYDAMAGIHGYKLQKNKDTIPIPNYEWVLVNACADTTIFDKIVNKLRGNIGTIFLFKYGSKQYKPIYINHDGVNKTELEEVKDKDGKPVYIDIYVPIDPRDKLGTLNFDVIDWDNMNFMIQEQRASIERRKKSSDFLKTVVVPLIMIGATAIVVIVMLKYGYDRSLAFPQAGQQMQTAEPVKEPAKAPNIPIISGMLPG
jgi:hypothetical protein